jgi:prevent-host-death family protein
MARSAKGGPPKRPRAVVDVAAAKARLPELIERAASGEEIVLARAGKPRARLVPLEDDQRALRVPGKGNGRFRLLPGFDDPFPPDMVAPIEDEA